MRLPVLRAAHAALAVALAPLCRACSLRAISRAGAASWTGFEAPLLDLRFALTGTRPAPPDILIVALDDEAVREAGAYPLPRSTIARITRAIHALGASAIGVDILFVDAGAEAEDAALEAALSETGAVIAAAGTFGNGSEAAESGPAIPYAERVLWPNERFRRRLPSGRSTSQPTRAARRATPRSS
jgi:adenylate cyclase